MIPDPLVSPDCDCTDLDGFMLNVEKLMASELVALASHEAVAAALFLWCRAWKQKPAASLPDDDKVIASFARLPLARFRKLKDHILRNFVKCSDGRLYHTTLAVEAMRAWQKKKTFQDKREKDAERLRKWRASQSETRDEMHFETEYETGNETRFVAEGQGQGQGQVDNKISSSLRSEGADRAADLDEDPKKALFGAGAEWLAEKSEQSLASTKSLIGKMLRDLGGDQHASLLLGIFRDTKRDGKAKPDEWILKLVANHARSRAGPSAHAGNAAIDLKTGKKWAS